MYNRIKHFVVKDEIIHRPRNVSDNIDQQRQQYVLFLEVYRTPLTRNSLSTFLFNLMKAYDFIHHGILLAKLVSYGIGGTTNFAINLYLLY